VIYAFFGHPGAGKTTLVERFARLNSVVGIDTDHFMRPLERNAVLSGSYTQAMRLANISRYCAHLRQTLPVGAGAALADGLPNDEARRFLLEQFPPGTVQLVLVVVQRGLWERRLAARRDNLVAVGVADAEAYVSATWEAVDPTLPHVVVENGDDRDALDYRLRELFEAG
jgi:predicted kinase